MRPPKAELVWSRRFRSGPELKSTAIARRTSLGQKRPPATAGGPATALRAREALGGESRLQRPNNRIRDGDFGSPATARPPPGNSTGAPPHQRRRPINGRDGPDGLNTGRAGPARLNAGRDGPAGRMSARWMRGRAWNSGRRDCCMAGPKTRPGRRMPGRPLGRPRSSTKGRPGRWIAGRPPAGPPAPAGAPAPAGPPDWGRGNWPPPGAPGSGRPALPRPPRTGLTGPGVPGRDSSRGPPGGGRRTTGSSGRRKPRGRMNGTPTTAAAAATGRTPQE